MRGEGSPPPMPRAKTMSVAVIASEVVPLSKTGGLADVAAALPIALRALGQAATVISPCYRSVWEHCTPRPTGIVLDVPVGPRRLHGDLLRAELPGTDVPVYLIHRAEYFDRPELYGERGHDYSDNAERFVFFARAALEALRLLGSPPHVIHCNDWQAGLVPTLLAEEYRPRGWFRHTGTVMTIHNMAYQGSFPEWEWPLLGLDRRLFHWQRLEFHNRINFLKAGLVDADRLTTVSPTYAEEIRTPDFGCGLDGLLRSRGADLSGIVNGIDSGRWDPARDKHLPYNYSAVDAAEGKAACKSALQRRASLAVRADVPLLAAIGRLDPQKGWDLLLPVLSSLAESSDVQIVVLGTGQTHFHEQLDLLAWRFPNKVWVFLDFSDPLAHLVEAGADIFLMPSLYEPCGLNQMYSQVYGTVPVVRSTGGLADTVVAADAATLADGTATGFAFHEATPAALARAIGSALDLWPDRGRWGKLVRAGMSRDFSWGRSAREYLELYQQIARNQHHAAASAG